MRVHFIASVKNYDRDINSYKSIIQLLKNNGLTLAIDWLNSASRDRKASKNWKHIYSKNMDAVAKSDIIVAEVSNKSFFVGFQVSSALQLRKPILLLSTTDNVDSVIGVDLNEENIRYSKYNSNNLEKIIKEFVDQNRSDGKQMRFNFFIDKKSLHYINWSSIKFGITKAEVIRKALKNDMEKTEFTK